MDGRITELLDSLRVRLISDPWKFLKVFDTHPDIYARRLDVINRGMSGYNTDWGIPVFEQAWPDYFEIIDEVLTTNSVLRETA